MEFLTWWFDSHPFWSTFLMPFWTLLWALFHDMTGRAVIAALWWLFGSTLQIAGKMSQS